MKAVIYTRVSSTGDRQNTDRQVADLKAYAEYRQLEVTSIFEEKISGAKKNSERPVLVEALDYCEANSIDILLVSELSRLGRNAFEVLEVVKRLVDNKINLFMQKEQFCAQLERENIKFRLNSGRAQYIAKGGKLGRKVGSTKTIEQKKEEYKEVITLLKKGYSIRNVAQLCCIGVSTVQRIKKDFNI